MHDQEFWIVLGTGGHARSVVDILHRQVTGPFIFVASSVELPAWAPVGSRVVAEDDLRGGDLGSAHWLVAVGDNSVRQRLMTEVVPPGAAMPPVVAVTATVAADVMLGRGSVILEHAHVGPGAVIGEGVIVNTGAVVEHDSSIGAFVHVAPRAVVLGSAHVGDRTLVGAGSTILPGLRVGSDVSLGAGSVVVDDLGEGITAVGIPARTIRRTLLTCP